MVLAFFLRTIGFVSCLCFRELSQFFFLFCVPNFRELSRVSYFSIIIFSIGSQMDDFHKFVGFHT